jgi:single-strand DNA-binding protein
MSGSYNMVVLIGNIGKDPELKMLPSGSAVCNFSLATTEEWKSKDGEKQKRTDWHNISAFGSLAEIIEKYAKKGQQVMVEGKINYREYDDAGKKRYATSIRCDRFLLLGKKSGEDNTTSPKHGGTFDDDDTPF